VPDPFFKDFKMKSHTPKKSLGQNFLINQNVQQRIIAACDLKPADIVLEIGPGKGALTRLIAPHVKKVIAVEKDTQLAAELKLQFYDSNVTIIHEDILKYSFDGLPDHIKIIGNLPYNIATPIIEKVLTYGKKFYVFYMTVQLEYGQRMAAKPSTKSYGSWSCFTQYYADIQMLFKVGRAAFYPVPKVQSCFLRLDIPRKVRLEVQDEKLFFKIIRSAFNQRRKTIMNSLSSLCDKTQLAEILESLEINTKFRAENLALEDYARITHAMLDYESFSHPLNQ